MIPCPEKEKALGKIRYRADLVRFRPSDDACTYGYLIPSNMFAVVVLGYLEESKGRSFTARNWKKKPEN